MREIPRYRGISSAVRFNAHWRRTGWLIEMLQRREGSSIAAIMKATGWQQHSVRGFFAGVVRKKLKLALESEKTDGARRYRIIPGKSTKPATEDAEHRAA